MLGQTVVLFGLGSYCCPLLADGVEGGLGPPLEALAQLQRVVLLVQQRVRRAVHGPAPARPVPAGPFLSSARRVRCRPAPFRAPSAAGKALRGRRRRRLGTAASFSLPFWKMDASSCLGLLAFVSDRLVFPALPWPCWI